MKIMEDMLQVQIIQSPHAKKPNAIFKALERQLHSIDYAMGQQDLDKRGLARLKEKMQVKGSKIKVK